MIVKFWCPIHLMSDIVVVLTYQCLLTLVMLIPIISYFESIVDPDQLVSKKSAGPALYCFPVCLYIPAFIWKLMKQLDKMEVGCSTRKYPSWHELTFNFSVFELKQWQNCNDFTRLFAAKLSKKDKSECVMGSRQLFFLLLLNQYSILYGPRHWKTWLCCIRTTKAQTSLRICAVWSAPLFFAL